MTLADILKDPANVAGLNNPAGDRRCKTRLTLDNLDTDDADALKLALHADSGWPNDRLAKTLTLAGHTISGAQIGNHRRRVCICDNYNEDGTTAE